MTVKQIAALTGVDSLVRVIIVVLIIVLIVVRAVVVGLVVVVVILVVVVFWSVSDGAALTSLSRRRHFRFTGLQNVKSAT